MTIIVALKDKENKRIILGSDKQATTGQMKFKTENKIIEKEIEITDGYGEIITTKKMHIALCGFLYLTEFLVHSFIPPSMSEKQDTMDYLYNDFFPELRGLLLEDNLIELDSNVTNTEAWLILVFEGEFYSVSPRFAVNSHTHQEFIVDGSGEQVATGSLYTNLNYHKDTDKIEMVKQAIKSCGANTIYCDTDTNIKIIKYGE